MINIDAVNEALVIFSKYQLPEAQHITTSVYFIVTVPPNNVFMSDLLRLRELGWEADFDKQRFSYRR